MGKLTLNKNYVDKGPVTGQNYLLGKFNEYSKIRLITIS